jgi:hypothetical protein
MRVADLIEVIQEATGATVDVVIVDRDSTGHEAAEEAARAHGIAQSIRI